MINTNDLIGHSTSLFLRYFRHGRNADENIAPSINLKSDLEFLKICWAVSSSLSELVKYLNEHRFEIQGTTEYQSELSDVSVRGPIESTKTVIQRIRLNNPNIVSYKTSKKIFHLGANPVLLWTILIGEKYCRQLVSLFPPLKEDNNTGILKAAHDVLFLINVAKKIPFIKSAFETFNVGNRPTATSLRLSRLNRKKLYRLSYDAYTVFHLIEQGNEDKIKQILRESLVIPKEDYQILELVLAFSLGESLSKKLGVELVLKELSLKGNSVILTVGNFSIDWQSRTESYQAPLPEPTEQKLINLLPNYDLNSSSDRPDIIVRDIQSKKVVAIGEAKFFKDVEGWRDPLRDALHQIIRYSRGYADGIEQERLIGSSCIGLMYYPNNKRPKEFPDNGPTVLDSADMLQSSMDNWTNRIIAFYESLLVDNAVVD